MGELSWVTLHGRKKNVLLEKRLWGCSSLRFTYSPFVYVECCRILSIKALFVYLFQILSSDIVNKIRYSKETQSLEKIVT